MFRPDWEGGDGMAGSSGWPTFRGFYPHASARGSGVRMQPYRPRPRSMTPPGIATRRPGRGKEGGTTGTHQVPGEYTLNCVWEVLQRLFFSFAVGSLAIRAIGWYASYYFTFHLAWLQANKKDSCSGGSTAVHSRWTPPTGCLDSLADRRRFSQWPRVTTQEKISQAPSSEFTDPVAWDFLFPLCLYVDLGGLGHRSCCRQACFRLLGTDDPYHLFFTLIGFRCQAVGAGRQLFVS